MARSARVASRNYVPLDVGFFDDEKVLDAGEDGAWLYLNALTRAKILENDGVLTRCQIARLGVPNWQRRLTKCCKAGLFFEREPGVYELPAWLKWNEAKVERQTRLEADRARKKRLDIQAESDGKDDDA